jgi:hypothetical protein
VFPTDFTQSIMKSLGNFIGALVLAAVGANAQTVTVNIVRPLSNGLLVPDALYVAATATSTYEIQSVQATVDGRSANLVFTTSAYSNCPVGICTPQPGWANTLSLAGLTRGMKTLTVTAIDVFGNSNSAQRTVVYDLPPTLTVMAPTDATVARPEVMVSVEATDDDAEGTKIDVFSGGVGGTVLASGTNTLNTTLNFNGADGGIVTLCFRAMDSIGQARLTYRQVYVQSSSNLVEIANVSHGRIVDVQADRLLFQTDQSVAPPPGYNGDQIESELFIKSRTNGAEGLIFHQAKVAVGPAFLAPQGATFVAGGWGFHGASLAQALYDWRPDDLTELGWNFAFLGVISRGNFAAWGWGNYSASPRILLTDLQATNSILVTNLTGFSGVSVDLAANGDIVFAPGNSYGSHSIYRFRNGSNTLLASIPGNQSTNQLVAPKIDGNSVFYIQITPTNQILKKITSDGEVTVAEGLTIGADYQLNNGWVAYSRSGGGQGQIWRCSPAGTNTQLTFYGTSSLLAALSPDGEVAFYNGTQLYISKGTWPPAEIATTSSGSGLSVLWQDGRWLAPLGRSLFQIYTGTPQLISPSFSGSDFDLGLVGPKGQHLVIEGTTNLVDWTAIATNYITDGANCRVQNPITPNVPGKMYRLRLQ